MKRAALLIVLIVLLLALAAIFRPAARPRCVCTEDGMRPGWGCRASPAEVKRCDESRGLYRLLEVVLA